MSQIHAIRLGLAFPAIKIPQPQYRVSSIVLPPRMVPPIIHGKPVAPLPAASRPVASVTSAALGLDLTQFHFKKPVLYQSHRRLVAQVTPGGSKSLTINKIEFKPEELALLKDPQKGYKVRVFIGNPDVKPKTSTRGDKHTYLKIQLPPACITFVNGSRLYQEKYLILNANTDHKFIPADITSYLKFDPMTSNTITFQFTSVAHVGFKFGLT